MLPQKSKRFFIGFLHFSIDESEKIIFQLFYYRNPAETQVDSLELMLDFCSKKVEKRIFSESIEKCRSCMKKRFDF